MKSIFYVKISFCALLFILPETIMAEKPIIGQYDAQSITILQTMNGERYLSQGGPDFVDYMVEGIDMRNKRVLDYGSALCGPALHLAQKYGARIDGIEVDPYLLNLSQSTIAQNNLTEYISVHLIESSIDIPLTSGTFDVIFSKESIVHVHNKAALFKEFYRLLKPGGILIVLDWFKKTGTQSADLDKTLEIDGWKFHYCTHQAYKEQLTHAGFSIIDMIETSDYHLKFIQDEYQDLLSTKGETIQKLLGNKVLEESINSWKSHATILESKEVQTFLFKATK